MPLPEEQVWGQRACDALERDGNSLEGALGSLSRRGPARAGGGGSGPRARRCPALGGVRPSSEMEPHPRGRPALERGEVVPGRRRTPRAERSSASRVAGPIV
jgi:hypothetical protein